MEGANKRRKKLKRERERKAGGLKGEEAKEG